MERYVSSACDVDFHWRKSNIWQTMNIFCIQCKMPKLKSSHSSYSFQTISLPYTFTPLDQSLLDAKKNICFKHIHFGVRISWTFFDFINKICASKVEHKKIQL